MEIVRCDGCEEDIKRNVWYFELDRVSRGMVFPAMHSFDEPETKKHFCSAECIAKWTNEQAEQDKHIKETLKKYGAEVK